MHNYVELPYQFTENNVYYSHKIIIIKCKPDVEKSLIKFSLQYSSCCTRLLTKC